MRELLKDSDPHLRIQAIRASESLYKAGPAGKTFAADYRGMTNDADPDVVIQAMLTLNLLKAPQHAEVIRATSSRSGSRGVKEIGRQLLQPQRSLGQPASNDAGAGYLNLTSDERRYCCVASPVTVRCASRATASMEEVRRSPGRRPAR